MNIEATRLSPERKAMFVNADALEAMDKLLKAVDRMGGCSRTVTAKVCKCHLFDVHDWDGVQFGRELNGEPK